MVKDLYKLSRDSIPQHNFSIVATSNSHASVEIKLDMTNAVLSNPTAESVDMNKAVWVLVCELIYVASIHKIPDKKYSLLFVVS